MDELPQGAELLIAYSWGIYIPQRFAEHYSKFVDSSIPSVTWTILKDGPEGDMYWDTWEYVLNDAVIKTPTGKLLSLHQDGDLWLIPHGA